MFKRRSWLCLWTGILSIIYLSKRDKWLSLSWLMKSCSVPTLALKSPPNNILPCFWYLDHVRRIRYLSPMRAAKVQASLRIRAVSPEPSLLAHTSSESRRTFRQKARSLAPLNGWACAVKICHDGMLEDTNSLDKPHLIISFSNMSSKS